MEVILLLACLLAAFVATWFIVVLLLQFAQNLIEKKICEEVVAELERSAVGEDKFENLLACRHGEEKKNARMNLVTYAILFVALAAVIGVALAREIAFSFVENPAGAILLGASLAVFMYALMGWHEKSSSKFFVVISDGFDYDKYGHKFRYVTRMNDIHEEFVIEGDLGGACDAHFYGEGVRSFLLIERPAGIFLQKRKARLMPIVKKY